MCLLISKVYNFFSATQSLSTDSAPKRARYSRTCKNLMEGHKNVKDTRKLGSSYSAKLTVIKQYFG